MKPHVGSIAPKLAELTDNVLFGTTGDARGTNGALCE